jgi:hypothetical protein
VYLVRGLVLDVTRMVWDGRGGRSDQGVIGKWGGGSFLLIHV